MDLKRLSLEKETKNNTITTHNKEPVRNKRKISHTLEPPTLRLDADYGETLYLKLCKGTNRVLYFETNLRYSEVSGCPEKDHFGYSINIFPELDEELKVMSSKLENTLLHFYFNFIILGRIYEAICKSGFDIADIEFDRDSLNDFVNKSLEFYGYHDYKFDYNLVVSALSNSTEFYDNICDSKKEFTIGDRKGILGYTEKYVYLQIDKDNVVTLSSTFTANIMNTFKETNGILREILAWILMFSNFYYVHNQNFVNRKLAHSIVSIPNSRFSKEQKITPDNFAQCFKQS